MYIKPKFAIGQRVEVDPGSFGKITKVEWLTGLQLFEYTILFEHGLRIKMSEQALSPENKTRLTYFGRYKIGPIIKEWAMDEFENWKEV